MVEYKILYFRFKKSRIHYVYVVFTFIRLKLDLPPRHNALEGEQGGKLVFLDSRK